MCIHFLDLVFQQIIMPDVRNQKHKKKNRENDCAKFAGQKYRQYSAEGKQGESQRNQKMYETFMLEKANLNQMLLKY